MEPITLEESRRLSFIVERVKANEATILETAQLLKELRDKRYYRGEAATFEQFCKQTFNICRSRGYQLIGFAEEVEMSTMVDTEPPKTEREARERKQQRNEARKPICDAPSKNPAPVLDAETPIAKAERVIAAAVQPVRKLSEFERGLADDLDIAVADLRQLQDDILSGDSDPNAFREAKANLAILSKKLGQYEKSLAIDNFSSVQTPPRNVHQAADGGAMSEGMAGASARSN